MYVSLNRAGAAGKEWWYKDNYESNPGNCIGKAIVQEEKNKESKLDARLVDEGQSKTKDKGRSAHAVASLDNLEVSASLLQALPKLPC